MVEHTLTKLGFNEKEIQVYLCVLEHGKISPADIARLTKINRTTVYSTGKELVKKGVLSEDIGGSTRSFIALPLTSFQHSLKKEEKKLTHKKFLTMEVIRELEVFAQHSKYSIPKIVFVEEDDIESHLYRQTPIWNRSILNRNADYLGFQDSSFVQYYEKWIDWYWSEEDTSRAIELKLLSNEKAEQIKQKKFSRRQIKFWNKATDFTATTWIMGDYVTMIVTNKRPHYLVEIHDQTLAHNMRQVFKGLWAEII